jgi:hypothetical protein
MNNETRNSNDNMSGIGIPLGGDFLRNQKKQCLAWISQIDRRWFIGGNFGGSERGLDQTDGDTEESDLPGIDESLAV